MFTMYQVRLVDASGQSKFVFEALTVEDKGVECTYEDRRLKGGVRTGVVERINQRLDALENMFLGQSILLQQRIQGSTRPLQDRREALRHNLHLLANSAEQNMDTATYQEDVSPSTNISQKRQADGEPYVPAKRIHRMTTAHGLDDGPLPETIHQVIGAYFRIVHPWIPVLHPATLAKRAMDPDRSPEDTMLLRAIVACSSRYLRESEITDMTDLSACAIKCREDAMAAAVEGNNVKTLQALVILIFDSLCHATASSAWSLVSLLARKVEQLHLHSEEADLAHSLGEYFLPTSAPASLPPAATWLEAEERRRVFWASFLMDRFSSIVTRRTPIFDSRTIHQRLPCDGCMWESDQCVETSYFRNGDQQQSDLQTCSEESPSFSSPHDVREGSSSLGGFAYTIEATENISLVAQFSQKYPLEPDSPAKLSTWLNRFRQLDSRLLQWELSLTPRWRDVRVVNGYIDPNATVAHMTHNAAIILLHQQLAFPPPQSATWLSSLVSTASREACITAASKIDRIARKYFAISDGIAPSQFALCLFIAGQFLLNPFSTHGALRASDELNSIISSLNELSQRLYMDHQNEKNRPDLPASRFAKALANQRDGRILHVQQQGNNAMASRSRCMTPNNDPLFMDELSANLQHHFATSISPGTASIIRLPLESGAEGIPNFMPTPFEGGRF